MFNKLSGALSLRDLAEEQATNIELYYHSARKIWVCYSMDTRVKEGNKTHSVYGSGKSIEGAISEYTDKIRGRRLVKNLGKENEREFLVSEQITFGK